MSKTNDFSTILCSWYEDNKRDLPWRATNNPYLIWISEIILQQTRVNQGYAYYMRFIERFPDVATLSQAHIDEVMKYWEGLGYYSRARNLHKAAQQICEMGAFPQTYEDIKKLKGVGEYTAAAIASFAYGMPYAVVDGNVYRVLSRYFGIDTAIDSGCGKKYFRDLATELLPSNNSSIYNQAIMDFGATQCTPVNPQCTNCPLCDSCQAYASSSIEKYPVKNKKLQVTYRYLNYYIIRIGNEVLLQRRNNKDIWQGLYEPFLIETKEETYDALEIDRQLSTTFTFTSDIQIKTLAERVRHQLTHRTLICNFYEITTGVKPTMNIDSHAKWYDIQNIQHLAFPKVIEKILKNIIND